MSYKLEIIHKQGKFYTVVENKEETMNGILKCLSEKMNYIVTDDFNSTVIPYRLLRKSIISITDKAKYENVTKPDTSKGNLL